jgi:hypothetical protein
VSDPGNAIPWALERNAFSGSGPPGHRVRVPSCSPGPRPGPRTRCRPGAFGEVPGHEDRRKCPAGRFRYGKAPTAPPLREAVERNQRGAASAADAARKLARPASRFSMISPARSAGSRRLSRSARPSDALASAHVDQAIRLRFTLGDEVPEGSLLTFAQRMPFEANALVRPGWQRIEKVTSESDRFDDRSESPGRRPGLRLLNRRQPGDALGQVWQAITP